MAQLYISVDGELACSDHIPAPLKPEEHDYGFWELVPQRYYPQVAADLGRRVCCDWCDVLAAAPELVAAR